MPLFLRTPHLPIKPNVGIYAIRVNLTKRLAKPIEQPLPFWATRHIQHQVENMLQFFFVNELWMLAIIVNDRFEHRTRLLVKSVQSPRQCEYLAIRFILPILQFGLRVQRYCLKAVTPRGDTRWSF